MPSVLTQLTLDADGTIDAVIRDSDADSTFFDDCNDAPDGVSADFVENDDSETSGEAWFSLTNVDSDFQTMRTLTIEADIQAAGFSNDTCTLTCRVFNADNDTTTPLCDESALLGDDTDSTRVQRAFLLGGLTGSKTDWDAAFIRFTWTYNRVGGPDNANLQLFGCVLEGTYNPDFPDRDKGAVQHFDPNLNRLDKGAVELNAPAEFSYPPMRRQILYKQLLARRY